jgi:phosphoserine phosphatase
MTKIAFIDRDGTVIPEALDMPRRRIMPFMAVSYLTRLAQKHDVKFVWNSRNPDTAAYRRYGRLYSRNVRQFDGGAQEHVALLKNSGLDGAYFYPEYPEVIHCDNQTKGMAMLAWAKARGIPIEDTIAFDDHPEQLEGYPADRIILVNSNTGVTRTEYKKALVLLELENPTSDATATARPAPHP